MAEPREAANTFVLDVSNQVSKPGVGGSVESVNASGMTWFLLMLLHLLHGVVTQDHVSAGNCAFSQRESRYLLLCHSPSFAGSEGRSSGSSGASVLTDSEGLRSPFGCADANGNLRTGQLKGISRGVIGLVAGIVAVGRFEM